MSKADVCTLDLGNASTALTADGSEIRSLDGLHYVWITVQTPEGVMTDLRFEVVNNRLKLKPDSYSEAVKEVDISCRQSSSVKLEWLATMISQPLPGVGRARTDAVSVNDSIEVGAFATYGLPGSTRDVVLGIVQRIVLYL